MLIKKWLRRVKKLVYILQTFIRIKILFFCYPHTEAEEHFVYICRSTESLCFVVTTANKYAAAYFIFSNIISVQQQIFIFYQNTLFYSYFPFETLKRPFLNLLAIGFFYTCHMYSHLQSF